MKAEVLSISVTELQQAVRDYCEKHAQSQPSTVTVVEYGKTYLEIPLSPGAVVRGMEFQKATESEE